MLKEVILIPKGKNPLDVLSEMGEKTKNAWIFFHKDLTGGLSKNVSAEMHYQGELMLGWTERNNRPAREIHLKIIGSREIWNEVLRIKASDIAFETEPNEPEYLFFIKMAE